MSEREKLARWCEDEAQGECESSYRHAKLVRIAALLRETPALPPAPPAGFVRCRAAVAVGRHGGYGVCGWIDENPSGWSRPEDELMSRAALHMAEDEGPRVSFVTFDAPLPPAPAEIVGKVCQ